MSKGKLSREYVQKVLKDHPRYEGFKVLQIPEMFEKLYAGYVIRRVNVIDIEPVQMQSYKGGIVGFCGAFSWDGSSVKSLDGDSYNSQAFVYAVKEISKNKKEIDELEIMVGNDW